MGPTALFDKSFLQSLSIDEAVWFDQFFNSNISPLFYVETLADLDKEMSHGKSADQVVGQIAEKVPQISGAPNVYHQELLLANLLGQQISMTERPIVAGGNQVESAGKRGVNIEISPEARAFNRWQDGEYLNIERDFAKLWRAHIKSVTFEKSSLYAAKLGIDISLCKNKEDAFKIANEIVSKTGRPYDLIEFIINAIHIPKEYHETFVHLYQNAGFPSLKCYAPYAAHVITIEIFFHICVSRGFISAARPSNMIDIAYLHYLPFCHVFISGDKLHRSTASLFLKSNQRFVWGPDLKKDLAKLNAHFMLLPQEMKDQGIISFASTPPSDGDYLTADLWDLLGEKWRSNKKNMPMSKDSNEKILRHVKGFTEARPLSHDDVSNSAKELDSLSIQRSIKRKRGSWYQLPKNLEQK